MSWKSACGEDAGCQKDDTWKPTTRAAYFSASLICLWAGEVSVKALGARGQSTYRIRSGLYAAHTLSTLCVWSCGTRTEEQNLNRSAGALLRLCLPLDLVVDGVRDPLCLCLRCETRLLLLVGFVGRRSHDIGEGIALGDDALVPGKGEHVRERGRRAGLTRGRADREARRGRSGRREGGGGGCGGT